MGKKSKKSQDSNYDFIYLFCVSHEECKEGVDHMTAAATLIFLNHFFFTDMSHFPEYLLPISSLSILYNPAYLPSLFSSSNGFLLDFTNLSSN